MKIDAPYNPEIKSSLPPSGLRFRLAGLNDSESITLLMAERNPDESLSEVRRKTTGELELNSSDPNYRLFVVDLNGKVVALCRYFHSNGLPKEKILYPSPSGWYCMGILVDQKYRRQGIARFLFRNRLLSLKEKGATLIYSMVDSSNLASVRMHQEFGFEEIDQAPGFLHIKFDGGNGILYQMYI